MSMTEAFFEAERNYTTTHEELAGLMHTRNGRRAAGGTAHVPAPPEASSATREWRRTSSELVPWQPPNHSPEIVAVDRQHLWLIALIRELARRDQVGTPKQEQLQSLIFIAGLTARHFAAEEACMAAIEYPKLDTHRLIHRDLLVQFREHVRGFEQGGQKLGHKLRSFLAFWLLPHLVESVDWQCPPSA
jgi:hemerythrin